MRDVSADGIEDGVAISHDLGKIHRVIVDDLIGTDLAQIIVVRRACGRDHARTQMFCQLYGKARDTARASLDQDRLARLQFQCVFDGADRRQPGKRQRSGIDMRHATGFPGDDGRLDGNLLGISALLANVADAEHLIADTEVADTLSNCRNDTGEIPSKNVGESRKLARFALAHLPVGAVDAGGDNINHDLVGCGHGIRHLAEFQNFRPAVPLDEGSFHWHSLLLRKPGSHV